MTLDVVMAKPKLVLIVGGVVFLLQSLVSGSRGAIIASSNFGVTQRPYIGLHCSTSFGRVEWQPCNVPMERRSISL